MQKAHEPVVKVKDLENPSKLLLRHLDRIEGASLLVVGAGADDFALLLKSSRATGKTVFFSYDFLLHRRLRSIFEAAAESVESLEFGAWYEEERHDAAIVYLPKSRRLIEYILTMTGAAVKPGGTGFLVGENNAGIRSARETLAQLIGTIHWSEAARHCVLYEAANESLQRGSEKKESWIESYEVELGGTARLIKSLPGVFSQGRLDKGTEFLIANFPPELNGKVLDFGCGSGVIGLAVRKIFPQTKVDLIDSSALAVESARLTLDANGESSDSVRASDGFSEVKPEYDYIISNPPFHSGVKTDYRVVEKLIAEARNYLRPNGRLMIVANRFLKYKPLLEKHFGNCRIAAENNAFRVFEGQKKNAR